MQKPVSVPCVMRVHGVLIRDPFLSVCQVHIVSRHGKSRCPLQRHPYGHSIPLAGIFAARSAPCPNPPPLRRHIPKFSASPKNAVSGPALSHSTLPDTARSLCFGPNPAASSAIPVTGSILCISECTPGIGVSYHGCFVIIGRLLPQQIRCVVWPVAFDFRWPIFQFLHDGAA